MRAREKKIDIEMKLCRKKNLIEDWAAMQYIYRLNHTISK